MLTAEEQDAVVVEALKLGRYRRRLNDSVPRLMNQRRANDLWCKRVEEFRNFLKELGDVPMPGLQDATVRPSADDKAHTSNGTQVV